MSGVSLAFNSLNRYYPNSFQYTLEELSNSEEYDISEEDLDDVWNAITDGKIEIDLWIWFFDYQLGKEFIITWGSYKGSKLAFQSSDDWGVILHSIRWKQSEVISYK